MRYLLLLLICSSVYAADSNQVTQALGRVSSIINQNSIYVDQKSGNGNIVTIEQTGNFNKIQGIDGSDYALIDGGSNTVNVKQGDVNGRNLIEFDISGANNSLLIWQARNTLTGQQDGAESGGHYISLTVLGNSNDLTLKQSNAGGSDSGHFIKFDILGNSNSGLIKQVSNGEKTFFGSINGDGNVFDVKQFGSGLHVLDLTLTGNGNSATVVQKGSGTHNATINLINVGGSSSLGLLQQGTANQSYSITQSCATLGGCSVSVTQGQ